MKSGIWVRSSLGLKPEHRITTVRGEGRFEGPDGRWPRELNIAMGQAEHHEQRSNDHENEQAGFGSDGSPGEPRGAVKRRVQQMSRHHHAAVGNGIDEALSIVPGEVQADREPQASCAPDSEAEEKADQRSSKCSDPTLSAIPEVYGAEDPGEQSGRRPKADAVREGEKGIGS